MMLQSMREALKIKAELGEVIDENKIGVALFIQKCRS
jgi:Rod binding domain-containing protein